MASLTTPFGDGADKEPYPFLYVFYGLPKKFFKEIEYCTLFLFEFFHIYGSPKKWGMKKVRKNK